MRRFSFLAILLLFCCALTHAQIPANYYDAAKGKKGRDLQRALAVITTNGHSPISYGVSENSIIDMKEDGTLWDIYSAPCCQLTPSDYGGLLPTQQCTEYSFEHLFCQSWFNPGGQHNCKDYPPYAPCSDLHHIFPTDANINSNYHNNAPYAEIARPRKISQNGTKWGYVNCACTDELLDTLPVFEPVDDYKGDIARALLYISVRYMLEDDDFAASTTMTLKSQFRPWALTMLKKWHMQDPVSQKEIDRNKQVYYKQRNANPLIDHPELVGLIWGTDSLYNTFGSSETTVRPTIIDLDSTENSITLTFDTPMEKNSAENIDNYNLSGGICIDSITYVNNQVVLTLASRLVKGTPYHLYIHNVQSESGVYVAETVKNFVFGRYASTYVFCGDPNWYPREVITAWTFDDLDALPSPIVLLPNEDVGVAANFSHAAIFADGSYGSSLFESGMNATSGDLSGDPRPNAKKLRGFNLKGASTNGKSIVIKFSTKNWQEIMLTFGAKRTSTGFKNHLWEWSLDGENYDTIAGVNTMEMLYCNKFDKYSMRELDLRELEIEDKDSVFLRMTVSEGSGQGTNTFDNFVIYGERFGYTSIREPRALASNVIIAPNPNNGIFEVHRLDDTPYTEIQIFDMTGRMQLRQTISNDETRIDLSHQPNGIYFVKMIAKNGAITTMKKIIIAK